MASCEVATRGAADIAATASAPPSIAETQRNYSFEVNPSGLHFFVFGGFNKTVDWINAQRAR